MRTPTTPRVRVVYGPWVAIGPGKAMLLEAIARTGSIAAAAREMRMTYKRAWQLVDGLNNCFREPLVEATRGGPHGGGAHVTPFGLDVLNRYRSLDVQVVELFRDLLAARPPAR